MNSHLFSDVRLSGKKSYMNLLVFSMLAGIFIYLTLISQQLTNHYDGLWIGPWFEAGSWELSIGRWFLLFMDRFRMGYAADPFNSYLALFFISLGNVFLADIFSLVGKKRAYLVSGMILSSTTVSVLLTYRFTSPNFGLAYLLSISGVWTLYKVKQIWVSMLVSSGMLCLSLGLYQADLGCTCLLVLLILLFMCLEKSSEKEILGFLVRSAVSIAEACLVYKLIWDMFMIVLHVEPNSYNGASNVSIPLILKKMPGRILVAYTQFFKYFFGNTMKHSIFQEYKFYVAVFLVFGSFLLYKGLALIKKKMWIRSVMYLSGILLIPAACNVSMILAPESGFMIQQTAGMSILFPSMLCLVSGLIAGQETGRALFKWFSVGISLFILYGNIYMTAIDLEVMYEGRTSSNEIMNHVVQTLIDQDLYSREREYVFVGRPSDSPMFQKTEILWNRANSYAHYGEFWTGAKVMSMVYDGLLRQGGVYIPVSKEHVYESYMKLDQIRNMPSYPAEGSIQEIEGRVVIKISNTY